MELNTYALVKLQALKIAAKYSNSIEEFIENYKLLVKTFNQL